jgi:phenylacetate-CoA ligase
MPRVDKILGRSDDMFIFRGVNIYPGQIGSVLENFKGLSAEYRIFLSRKDGLDHMAVHVERAPGAPSGNDDGLARALADEIRKNILVRGEVTILGPGELPRSFSKTKRVEDSRGEE